MKTISIFLAVSLIFSLGCNNKNLTENQEKDNVLLANEVSVKDRVSFANEKPPKKTSEIKHDFIKKMFAGVLDNKLDSAEKRGLLYTAEEIQSRMGEAIDTVYDIDAKTGEKIPIISRRLMNTTEIKSFLFAEKWYMPNSFKYFSKEIKTWMPIRHFYRDSDIEQADPRIRIAFKINNSEDKSLGEKVAENFQYKFDVYGDKYLDRTGLDIESMFESIIENIKSGNLIAYHPDWINDNKKKQINYEQIEKLAEADFDSGDEYDITDKLFFVEDWYFNFETFNFFKKVKALGFVDTFRENDKPLFFIFFSEEQ